MHRQTMEAPPRSAQGVAVSVENSVFGLLHSWFLPSQPANRGRQSRSRGSSTRSSVKGDPLDPHIELATILENALPIEPHELHSPVHTPLTPSQGGGHEGTGVQVACSSSRVSDHASLITFPNYFDSATQTDNALHSAAPESADVTAGYLGQQGPTLDTLDAQTNSSDSTLGLVLDNLRRAGSLAQRAEQHALNCGRSQDTCVTCVDTPTHTAQPAEAGSAALGLGGTAAVGSSASQGHAVVPTQTVSAVTAEATRTAVLINIPLPPPVSVSSQGVQAGCVSLAHSSMQTEAVSVSSQQVQAGVPATWTVNLGVQVEMVPLQATVGVGMQTERSAGAPHSGVQTEHSAGAQHSGVQVGQVVGQQDLSCQTGDTAVQPKSVCAQTELPAACGGTAAQTELLARHSAAMQTEFQRPECQGADTQTDECLLPDLERRLSQPSLRHSESEHQLLQDTVLQLQEDVTSLAQTCVSQKSVTSQLQNVLAALETSNFEAQQQVRELQAQLDASHTRAAAAEQQAATLQLQLDASHTRAAAAEQQAATLQAQLDASHTRAAAAEQQAATLQLQLDASHTRAAAAEQQAATLQAQLDASHTRAAAAEQQAATLQAQLDASHTRAAAAEQQAATLQLQLDASHTRAAAAEQQAATLQLQLDASHTRAAAAEQQAAALQSQLHASQAQLLAATAELAERTAEASRRTAQLATSEQQLAQLEDALHLLQSSQGTAHEASTDLQHHPSSLTQADGAAGQGAATHAEVHVADAAAAGGAGELASKARVRDAEGAVSKLHRLQTQLEQLQVEHAAMHAQHTKQLSRQRELVLQNEQLQAQLVQLQQGSGVSTAATGTALALPGADHASNRNNAPGGGGVDDGLLPTTASPPLTAPGTPSLPTARSVAIAANLAKLTTGTTSQPAVSKPPAHVTLPPHNLRPPMVPVPAAHTAVAGTPSVTYKLNRMSDSASHSLEGKESTGLDKTLAEKMQRRRERADADPDAVEALQHTDSLSAFQAQGAVGGTLSTRGSRVSDSAQQGAGSHVDFLADQLMQSEGISQHKAALLSLSQQSAFAEVAGRAGGPSSHGPALPALGTSTDSTPPATMRAASVDLNRPLVVDSPTSPDAGVVGPGAISSSGRVTLSAGCSETGYHFETSEDSPCVASGRGAAGMLLLDNELAFEEDRLNQQRSMCMAWRGALGGTDDAGGFDDGMHRSSDDIGRGMLDSADGLEGYRGHMSVSCYPGGLVDHDDHHHHASARFPRDRSSVSLVRMSVAAEATPVKKGIQIHQNPLADEDSVAEGSHLEHSLRSSNERGLAAGHLHLGGSRQEAVGVRESARASASSGTMLHNNPLAN